MRWVEMSHAPDTMLCTIFKGSRERELYVFVPRENGEKNIPDSLRERMGELSQVMTLQISADRKLARADAATVLSEIREKGYYLQLPPEISGQVLFDGD